MRIVELLQKRRRFISLEFFPPKDRALWPRFFQAAGRLRQVHPLFVSVTYGAMGGTRSLTLELVSRLKNELGLETMAHLTCFGATPGSIDAFLKALIAGGVDNVLALRGDLPKNGEPPCPLCGDFRCAADLVRHVRARYPALGVAVAAYPEGHPEAPDPEADLRFLKLKFAGGADFAITQLFFDNRLYWDFIRRARAAGITAPVIPGILPVTNFGNVARILSMCGASIPPPYMEELREADRRGGAAAVSAVGIAYARRQAMELFDEGAPGVHLYTLNKAEACLALVEGLERKGPPP